MNVKKKAMDSLEKIAAIETALKKLKTEPERRLYLYGELKTIIQERIKLGDPYQGATLPEFKFIRAELRWMSACRRVKNEKY